MRRYVLDTDHVSLILRNHPIVPQVAAQYEYAVTVITVQELFNGWVGKVNTASLDDLPTYYSKLWSTTIYLQSVEILDFTPEADICLRQLLKNNPLLRKNRLQKDMRIAAIALVNNAIVVTRNHRDFSQVQGLKITDWSILT